MNHSIKISPDGERGQYCTTSTELKEYKELINKALNNNFLKYLA